MKNNTWYKKAVESNKASYTKDCASYYQEKSFNKEAEDIINSINKAGEYYPKPKNRLFFWKCPICGRRLSRERSYSKGEGFYIFLCSHCDYKYAYEYDNSSSGLAGQY